MGDVRTRVREFFCTYVDAPQLRDDLDIFRAGLANSLFALQLVDFVETQLGVAVTDQDLDLDNFRSVDAITRFVTSKHATAADPGTDPGG
jgi:acyl carrier protein